MKPLQLLSILLLCCFLAPSASAQFGCDLRPEQRRQYQRQVKKAQRKAEKAQRKAERQNPETSETAQTVSDAEREPNGRLPLLDWPARHHRNHSGIGGPNWVELEQANAQEEAEAHDEELLVEEKPRVQQVQQVLEPAPAPPVPPTPPAPSAPRAVPAPPAPPTPPAALIVQKEPVVQALPVASQQPAGREPVQAATINMRGTRSDANHYYIDGIKVRGANAIPKEAIEQVTVITGGLPDSYGEVNSGIIHFVSNVEAQQIQKAEQISMRGSRTDINMRGVRGCRVPAYIDGVPFAIAAVQPQPAPVPQVEEEKSEPEQATDFTFAPMSLEAKVWPNPTRGMVNIALEEPTGNPYTVDLFDLSGKKMGTVRSVAGGQTSFNAYEFSAGIYIYHITDAESGLRSTGRLVVE